ncbi:MAG TPA: hypothetical protein VEJ87_16625 [Acidimicrobiales bacterium]|nr:hypothetical protein [Acidimicrobiales bacterium]
MKSIPPSGIFPESPEVPATGTLHPTNTGAGNPLTVTVGEVAVSLHSISQKDFFVPSPLPVTNTDSPGVTVLGVTLTLGVAAEAVTAVPIKAPPVTIDITPAIASRFAAFPVRPTSSCLLCSGRLHGAPRRG